MQHKMSQTFINFAVLSLMAIFACGGVSARVGYGPGEQDWGFVDVRPGAHMFYWLYYTNANVSHYTERPLAIWLQGGPGASSTGYGNFEEIGPLDLHGNVRNFSWVNDMNVLFIDSPVGSGYSYVDSVLHYTTNNKQIAQDLVALMKGFYRAHPEFAVVPLHIFCESYGGKVAPEFALELYYAVQRGELKSNLTTVALGDAWTSPLDSMHAWAPLLYQMSFVDQEGYDKIQASVQKTVDLVEAGKWSQATMQWGTAEGVVLQETHGIDFYNVEEPIKMAKQLRKTSNEELLYRTFVQRDAFDDEENRDAVLQELMRGSVAEALRIPASVKWGAQQQMTFARLYGDFMKPVVHIVSELLDNTTVKVAVYSGQLDLICATPGTVSWIEKMDWIDKPNYEEAPRNPITVSRILEGYEKSAGNFYMFWINRAGHMLPRDNPAGMSHILRTLTNFG